MLVLLMSRHLHSRWSGVDEVDAGLKRWRAEYVFPFLGAVGLVS